ncbi:PREDICTED: acyl-CoA-binding domain-containing protein 6-like isoform X2 [Priapulus caudatus]|uniref:Acyl-CoA-binding domain-containing protein 6 n=1 Tax=Priapulus caudatus TaxID=37621 RepID=A0ABM1EG98_PRICU|nr:PREDICTED: acyl-CoA-binding domain-containing protein 6-like isoform X2 [Priapulus caudatus]
MVSSVGITKRLTGKTSTLQYIPTFRKEEDVTFPCATVGPCDIPKPGFFDFQGKQKWEAWNQLGKMKKNDAMKEYIDYMSKLYPDWVQECQGNQRSTFGGVVVSCMKAPEEEPIADADKSLIDWIVDGNTENVRRMLGSKSLDCNQVDEQGMAALHWACDRGHTDIVELLLRMGADPDIRDAECQTPLHYACSCDHVEVVKLLLGANADRSTTDCNGDTPVTCATSPGIVTLLNSSVSASRTETAVTSAP